MKLLRLLSFWLAIALPSSAAAGIQYYVDPLNGTDAPAGGSQGAPWKTVAYAVSRIVLLPAASQAGLVLNLRAYDNVLYPAVKLPATLHGTPEQPMVIQPWQGDRVAFDGGESRFRQPGAWEPVPGQVDEWRTKDTFQTAPRESVAVGQMMDTRFRLIKYAEIEDMRAANESFHKVPLSDPRPGFGPLADDPTFKYPFTYLGPGLTYVFENPEKTIGRTHIRLSPTHIHAPGIQDYAGGEDPNTMALSIARTGAITATIAAQNVILRRLVFQNGGETTVQVNAPARNVTFDHCEVYGGRFGVRISPLASELRFHDCTFDGGLAPWTSRSDVKNEYLYDGVPGCPTQDGHCINNMGAHTHDMLVIHGASRSEYVRCTFRRAHDGIGLRGDDVEIRDSLFEDINDEVLQLVRPGTEEAPIPTHANLKIHGNVFRQVLHPLSFVLNPLGGPVYFYRNVIDQRAPTRGYRVLPPDAPAPWIWRYGADFKDTPTLPFHCYQNTFVASHDLDKASYLSHLFYSDPPVGPTFLNNVYVGLNLGRPLRVPSLDVGAVSNGNVWYRYEGFPDPLSPRPLWVHGTGKYFTLDELHAAVPSWETQSQYADPQLANFTDEHFEYASFHPNTDYRPLAGGPADLGGVALPSGLPDDFPSTVRHAGARPAGAPVMTVGVDAATPFPASGVPVALAGSDQTLVDADGDGFEEVTLQGAGSFDPDGTIEAYAWSTLDQPLADAATALVFLPEGDHYARLVVTDNDGKVDSDAVRVRVAPAVPGENRLTCPGFEERTCEWQFAGGVAARTKGAHSGRLALQLTQNGAAQTARQRVAVSLGRYTVSGWLATDGLSARTASLAYSVLDADGAVLATQVFARKGGTSPYTYHEATIGPVKGAAFIEVAAALAGSGPGRALFDDLRIRDRNLLKNGRFEVRAVNGQEDEAPGWAFVRGGRVVDDPASVYSGQRALALVPGATYHFIAQEIAHSSAGGYRASAWVKTSGLSEAPTFDIIFHGPAGQELAKKSIALADGDSDYTFVMRTLEPSEIPLGTASLTVAIGLAKLTEGAAFFDDVMVEPLP